MRERKGRREMGKSTVFATTRRTLPLLCALLSSFTWSTVGSNETDLQLPPGSLDALRSASRDGVVVVATLSWGMLSLFHNWQCSIKSNGLPSPAPLVFAQDSPTYHHVLSLGYPAVLSASSSDSHGLRLRDFRTDSYHALVRDRLAFLLGALSQGYNLLTVDVDAIWLRDPLSYIDTTVDISAPLELQSSNLARPADGSPPTRGPEFCACMLYLSATPRVVALLTAALGELRDPKFEFNEQKVLSYLLLPAMARGTPWEGITLKWLPKPEFPSGREYFGLHVHREPGYNESERASVAVVHNNWVKSSGKVQRFKQSRMWYVQYPLRSTGRFRCIRT